MGSRNGTLDPEVRAKKAFRRYTAAYKLKILLEADRCSQRGETGALLRRENRRLARKLQRAEAIIDIQKKAVSFGKRA